MFALASRILKRLPEGSAKMAPALTPFGGSQQRLTSTMIKTPKRVAVTGAAGQIGYQLLFRIASGQLLGPDQPVIIHAIELEQAMNALRGVAMELDDCAFPLLHGVVQTSDLNEGFDDIDYALLVGSRPRGKGMERQELLSLNGKIFVGTGKALNDKAKKTAKILVVGNPANTNCLVASANAPNIPPENFAAMTRLDHDRAVAQIAIKTKSHSTDVSKLAIWGNHSATQYPYINDCEVKGKRALDLIKDENWVKKTFIPCVQQRGAAIIAARGLSSAASAANAAIMHTHDRFKGTNGKWVSMAVASDGSYGIEDGLFFSYPVTCNDDKYEIVQGLDIDSYSAEMIEKTKKELLSERDMVKDLLP